MRDVKKYLDDKAIQYKSNDKARAQTLRFMINQKIYLIGKYKNAYELCTIDRELVKDFKSQKALIAFIENLN